MHKHIGIRDRGVPTLAELLYFDEVVVASPPSVTLESSMATINHFLKEHGVQTDSAITLNSTPAEDIARFDALAKHGVIVDIAKYLDKSDAQRSYKSAQDLLNESTGKAVAVVLTSLIDAEKNKETRHELEKEDADHRDASITEIRRRVRNLVVLPHRRAIESHPDCIPTTIFADEAALMSSNSDSQVLEIVLNTMPTLSADTSIEAVLNFRANSDAMMALRRLRRWMSQVATKKMSASEIEGELVELVDKYTEYMNIHKLKYTTGKLHTLVSVSLDVLDNLARLRFKSVFDSLFALHTQRIALTEAELKAPGREAAYIVHTQQAFQVAK